MNKRQDEIDLIPADSDQGFPCLYRFGDLIRQFVQLTVKNLSDWHDSKCCIMNHTDTYDYHPDIKSIIVQRISKTSLGHSPPAIIFPLCQLKNCR